MAKQTTIDELLKLADYLDLRSKEALAKAAVHQKQGEAGDVAKEERRAKSGEHYAGVCRDAAEKLSAKEKRGAFVPPSLPEVAAEMKRWGLPSREAEKFMAHFGNTQWRLASGLRMSSWKLAVVTWRESYFEKHPAERPSKDEQGSLPMGKILSSRDPEGWAEFLKVQRTPYQPHRFAPDFLKEQFTDFKQ